MRIVCSFLLFFPVVCGASPEDQQKRVSFLEGRLLAPCCYREPLNRHQSDTAVKMHMQVVRLVADNKSDAEILDYYVGRYGAKVVADFVPAPGWAPWIPWGLALLGAAGLAWWLPRLAHRSAPAQP